MGMPRIYWVFLEDQGLDLGNLISTIGAFFMAFGVIVFLYNIIITSVKGEPASADPWDGRTLEWAVSSPPPYYNFEQLPLVRGLDPLWIEKTEGKGKMAPGEPLVDVHMPRSEEHTSELQSRGHLVCRLLLEKKKKKHNNTFM